MTALLRLQGITLVRGGRVLAEGLDLALAPGERMQLTGPNGSGKSSLMRLAAGLLRPAAGTVDAFPLALADERTALDFELPLSRALRFWERPNAASEVDEAIDAFGLTSLADVPVRLLSMGQLKRASLARVAASAAPLWLLDEPLNGLDSDGASRLSRAIDQHTASGGAVLAASHVALGAGWRNMKLGL